MRIGGRRAGLGFTRPAHLLTTVPRGRNLKRGGLRTSPWNGRQGVSVDWVLGGASQLSLAGVLLIAGVGKLANPRAFARSVGQLRVAPAASMTLAGVLILTEVGTGVALFIAPRWPGARLSAAGLAVLFAAAGTLALASQRTVACACFGAVSNAKLGWRQVLGLPLWLLGLAMATVWSPRWSVQFGLTAMFWILAVWFAERLRRALGGMRDVRWDRVAFIEGGSNLS